ncbi:MAG: hypothetical protein IJR35_10705 [Synergistaceae bacterium]|nr:hypothetical protein [Synergistaceae bacterium]MBQ9404060.1 hypothetical protein [Synergistaceae bacterium]MBQ9596313.1 hypothetical protein [Synergistaceae bacterium]MBR0204071.1 hypothetical protein [Synergistaceae bacterium]
MKEYSEPKVIGVNGETGFAFPALGLAVATGYLVGKAATAVAKTFEASLISPNVPLPESVII